MIRWNNSEKEVCQASIVTVFNGIPIIVKKEAFKRFLANLVKINGEKEKYEAILLRSCIETEGARIIFTEDEIVLYFSRKHFWEKNGCTITENPELHTLLKELVQSSMVKSHS